MTSSRYNDYGDVMIRLDEDPAGTISMTESTTSQSIALWRGASLIR